MLELAVRENSLNTVCRWAGTIYCAGHLTVLDSSFTATAGYVFGSTFGTHRCSPVDELMNLQYHDVF